MARLTNLGYSEWDVKDILQSMPWTRKNPRSKGFDRGFRDYPVDASCCGAATGEGGQLMGTSLKLKEPLIRFPSICF